MSVFHKLLNKDGVLYIDITSKREFQSKSFPIEEKLGVRKIDGKKVCVIWRISHDTHRKLRHWESLIEVNGVLHKTVMVSLLLDCSDLEKLIYDAGFRTVRRVHFLKELNYDALLCEK